MISKYFTFFWIIVIFISCGNGEQQDDSKYTEIYEQKKKQKAYEDSLLLASLPKKDTNVINHNNVVDKLTYFGNANPETKVQITTKFGNIKIKLYEDTPLHRANFIMLAKNHVLDSTLFYRVVDGFVIQGGNSDRGAVTLKMKENGRYTIPPEIHEHHIHKRGSLAMAVSEQLDIPEEERNKNSSAYNFYIVQNKPLSKNYLNAVIKKYDLNLTEKEKQIYRTIGGTPHLDGDYTVFGEVTSGFSVIDKIAELPTDKDERPFEDIVISVQVID